MTKVPGVEASTGSLGHGFPTAVGLTLGLRILNKKNKVFVLLGDGECHEGTIWEAANIANDNCDGLGCYIPQCTENCEWESMQCWGSTGSCWCVDDSGIEIEGTYTPSWEGFPDCEECFDFTDIDFGACTMMIGVGLTQSNAALVSEYRDTSDAMSFTSLVKLDEVKCRIRQHAIRC